MKKKNKFEKAEECEVKELDTPATTRYFNVKNKKGEEYSVVIKLGCTCRYSSVQGHIHKRLCSHEIQVLKKMLYWEFKKMLRLKK